MSRGKIILIEGTDCSGKETQSKLLIDKLNNMGEKTVYFSFPNYSSPTGKIIGLSYLGKPYLGEELIDDNIDIIKSYLKEEKDYDDEYVDKVLDSVKKALGKGWFPEGAPHVDPKVSSLYYAADRAYNIHIIEEYLEEGINVVLDRYVYSNMGHQGGKCETSEERANAYDWISHLEFDMMGLPQPDVKLFLHMPTDYTVFLKKGRLEKADELERDITHLHNAEQAYLELVERFGFDKICCIKDENGDINFNNIKTPEEISDEVFTVIEKEVYNNKRKGL